MMRFSATLFLLAACVPSSWAIYADEVNHVDFHHALLGTPSPETTFFLRPSSSSSASLLYTLSERLLLGAVNPKDGTIVWRQNLTRSVLGGERPATGFLRGSEGTNTVVSAAGTDVSAWSATDGKLIWESRFPGELVADLELLELQDASAEQNGSKDVIVLSEGQGGVVRRLDGNSGDVKWERKDESGDVPFQVSSSASQIFYISLQSALLKGYKIKVTSLDVLSGRQSHQYILSSENEVSGPESIFFVGANNASPVIVWTDKSRKTLKINILGSKQVSTVNIENTSGEDVRSITVHAPRMLNSLPHFLIGYETESSSWAEVYHVDLQSSSVSKAYSLPRVQEKSVYATSNIDANVYFTRIAEYDATVVSSASHGILGRWKLQSPSSERDIHAVSEVIAKGDTVAVRSAAVSASGDWRLIRNGQTDWTRYESLAGAVAAAWGELDDGESLAHELEIEGHESVAAAYIHRVKRHLRDLELFPEWLRGLPKRIASSFVDDEVSNLEGFGIHKPVIVATETGRLLALDTGNHGAISWSVNATGAGERWNVKAITTQPGLATAYADDGSSVTVNITTGVIISRTPKTTPLGSVAIVSGGLAPVVVGVKVDGTPVDVTGIAGFMVTMSSDGRVLGWSAANVKSPVWEFVPPLGQKIIRATARPSHDPVASIGKVLGDRSVLYKYLNPNLALVTAVGDNSATFYLLDAISGRVLHAMTQNGVDTTQPIPSAISENWFAYSFWADPADANDAKGYRLVVSELFESPIPNDRGPLGSASNYSSIHGPQTLPDPHVISQAFVIPEPISQMAVTQTRQGITIRQLLCVLPDSDAIIGIPRYVLDPRRPIDRDPTSAEAEEGLFKYAPVLDFDGKWYITHSRSVAGIKSVLSAPTLLESTSLIFAFGSDVFCTRVTPSQAFDVLGKSFSKLSLLATVVALAAGVVVLAPMARKKQVDMLWKTSS